MTATQTIHLEPPISSLDPSPGYWALAEEPLYPGVLGFAFESRGLIYIPFIVAEWEGSGQVGKFLDALSQRCCILCVTNPKLRGMLERRGYVMRMELDQRTKLPIDIWQRKTGREDA